MDSDDDDAWLVGLVEARAEVISVADGVECIGTETGERVATDDAASE